MATTEVQTTDTPTQPAVNETLLDKMRTEWDERARENARYYIATANTEWADEAYFQSGRENIYHEVLTDMGNVAQGMEPKAMTVLEIGCGSGRLTRALAENFGTVYAVDISGEMIERAKESLRAFPNANVFQNNGADLQVLDGLLPEGKVDFAFSYIVFQHIPSAAVIHSYVREVFRFLKPGGLFKFQVQGCAVMDDSPEDTWLGVHFTDESATAMAHACGFEPRYFRHDGEQYFWLWFFKPKN